MRRLLLLLAWPLFQSVATMDVHYEPVKYFRPSLQCGVEFLATAVMKLEPRAVTLFFRNGLADYIGPLREALTAGTLQVIRCDPDRVC